MTVKQFFYAATDLKYDDVVSIVNNTDGMILYRGPFIAVLTTVYAQYTVHSFSQKYMYIKVL